MKITKLITKESFQAWILEQADDRPVNMSNCWAEDIMLLDTSTGPACGCVMMQYEEVLGKKLARCSNHEWFTKKENGGVVFEMIAKFDNDMKLDVMFRDGIHNKAKTFGELKKDLI
jgi:hypothetical protein